MKTLLVVGFLASPAFAEVPKLKLTSTTCTVDGAPIEYADDIWQGAMVETPKGQLAIVDGDGKLRLYHLDAKATTKGCKLVSDGTLTLAPKYSPRRVMLDADAKGTIYASSYDQSPLRVVDGKVTSGCSSSWLRASPLSDHLWPARSDATCDGTVFNSRTDFGYEPTRMWAVDDRAVVYGENKNGDYVLYVYGADGKRAGELPNPSGSVWDPERIVRCGSAVCAVNSNQLAVWDAAQKLVGTIGLGTLTKRDESLWPIDFTSGPAGSYLLVRDNSLADGHPRRKTWLVRVEGLPK